MFLKLSILYSVKNHLTTYILFHFSCKSKRPLRFGSTSNPFAVSFGSLFYRSNSLLHIFIFISIACLQQVSSSSPPPLTLSLTLSLSQHHHHHREKGTWLNVKLYIFWDNNILFYSLKSDLICSSTENSKSFIRWREEKKKSESGWDIL